eukprot:6211338-Pleurochrysis_carterae.AAC.1
MHAEMKICAGAKREECKGLNRDVWSREHLLTGAWDSIVGEVQVLQGGVRLHRLNESGSTCDSSNTTRQQPQPASQQCLDM